MGRRVFEAKYDNKHPCPFCGETQCKGQRLTYITAHADCVYPDKSRDDAQEDNDE
jgi:hypothetical protein